MACERVQASTRPRVRLTSLTGVFFFLFLCVGRFCALVLCATCRTLRIVSRWCCCSAVLRCCFSDVPTAVAASDYDRLCCFASSFVVVLLVGALQAKVVSAK
jgi:hypothetical protein